MPYLNYGGILADDEIVARELAEQTIELARDLGVDHVELRHTADLLDWPKRTDKVSMRLEVGEDPDALWSSLGSKLRAQIKRPKREGAVSRIGGVELLDAFYPVFSRKYRDLGIPVYPRRWFETLVRTFPESTNVSVVELGGHTVAASIVFGHGNVLEVPWAASLREADRFSVNMLLYWSMLEYACSNGYSVFDFGRCSLEDGTFRFKKQWGSKPTQLYWHYFLPGGGDVPMLTSKNPKYRLANTLWRKLPVPLANRIGPFIVRNLP